MVTSPWILKVARIGSITAAESSRHVSANDWPAPDCRHDGGDVLDLSRHNLTNAHIAMRAGEARNMSRWNPHHNLDMDLNLIGLFVEIVEAHHHA